MIVNHGIPEHKCFKFCFLELCKSLPKAVQKTARDYYDNVNIKFYMTSSSYYRHVKAIKNHTGVDIKTGVISQSYERLKNYEF